MRNRPGLKLPIILLLVLALVFLISGCTNTANDTSKTGVAKNAVSGGNSTSSNLAAVPAADTAATNGQTGQGTIPDAPKLIKTADATIEVGTGEFEKKFEDAKRLADKFAGHVTNSSANRTQGELISGIVTIRVPSKSFDDAITAVKALGKVNSINIKADDVSEEYVDLQSRLKNLQAQEGQLLTIMAKAQTVAEILAVQQQLTSVQGEIEVIKGRMQYLDNRVDFSTINITIQEPGAVVPAADEWGFVTALRTAAKAFIAVLNGLIIALGGALPIIIVIILIVMFIRAMAGRSKRNV